eukprot:366551-Chlamydomonas_euryale.AAC.5
MRVKAQEDLSARAASQELHNHVLTVNHCTGGEGGKDWGLGAGDEGGRRTGWAAGREKRARGRVRGRGGAKGEWGGVVCVGRFTTDECGAMTTS